MHKKPFWKKSQLYRSIAFVVAACGSVALFLAFRSQSLWFLPIMAIMFLAAIVAIVGVFLALAERKVGEVVFNLLLMLWLIALPLVLINMKIQQSIEQKIAPTTQQEQQYE